MFDNLHGVLILGIEICIRLLYFAIVVSSGIAKGSARVASFRGQEAEFDTSGLNSENLGKYNYHNVLYHWFTADFNEINNIGISVFQYTMTWTQVE